jgi:hypothetical protein
MRNRDRQTNAIGSARISLLLGALGVEAKSFDQLIEWTLCEHLVSILASGIDDPHLFSQIDALKKFRGLLRARTHRDWSDHDLAVLFERVKTTKQRNFRQPVAYGEYLKLLWQAPLRCAQCGKGPPKVTLHVDHIVPAASGGDSRRANLQFLCSTDNLRKGAKREVSEPWLNLL